MTKSTGTLTIIRHHLGLVEGLTNIHYEAMCEPFADREAALEALKEGLSDWVRETDQGRNFYVHSGQSLSASDLLDLIKGEGHEFTEFMENHAGIRINSVEEIEADHVFMSSGFLLDGD